MFRSRLPVLISEKEIRERRPRISQRELADATGIRQATISQWMNWATFKRLDAEVIAAFAAYFGCEPADLFEWVGDEEGQPEAAV